MDPGSSLAAVRDYDFGPRQEGKKKVVISCPTNFQKNPFPNPDITTPTILNGGLEGTHTQSSTAVSELATVGTADLKQRTVRELTATPDILFNGRGPKRAPKKLRKKEPSLNLRADAQKISALKSESSPQLTFNRDVEQTNLTLHQQTAKTIKIRRGLTRRRSTFDLLTKGSMNDASAAKETTERPGPVTIPLKKDEDLSSENLERSDSGVLVDLIVQDILSRTQSGFDRWTGSIHETPNGHDLEVSSADRTLSQDSSSTPKPIDFDTRLGGTPMADHEVMRKFQQINDQVSKRMAKRNANNCLIVENGRAVHEARTSLPKDVPKQLNAATNSMSTHDFGAIRRASVAQRRVFEIEELLEQILGGLSLRDLIACQRVSKGLRKSISTSAQWRRRLFLAPASQPTKSHGQLNPLLTTLGNISHLHPVHQRLNMADYLPAPSHHGEPLGPVLARQGRYYIPQSFYGHASNPILHHDAKSGFPSLDLELRELSKHEAALRAQHAIFPDDNSSIWKMYFCQPPPSEVRITIWKREGTIATVSEKMVVRGWTVKEIIENMEEARKNPPAHVGRQFMAAPKPPSMLDFAIRAVKGGKTGRLLGSKPKEAAAKGGSIASKGISGPIAIK